MKISAIIFAVAMTPGFAAQAEDQQLKIGKDAIMSMSGCYNVDYNFIETQAIKPGYQTKPESLYYDVNKDKSVKEWIYTEEISDTHIRVQHILFATKLDGTVMLESMLKHQAEDWVFAEKNIYDFTAPLTWKVKAVEDPGTWTRKITNLDDGLRYQCAAAWTKTTEFPEWACGNYAPIPGRETRDMKRKDYNTLDRTTRVIAYGNNWLERQENIKVIYGDDQSKTPLAKEEGKTWYTRLPDSQCKDAQNFAQARRGFWKILRESWETVLTGDRDFVEIKVPAGEPTRYMKMQELEEKYIVLDVQDPSVSKAAQAEILKVISEFRAN